MAFDALSAGRLAGRPRAVLSLMRGTLILFVKAPRAGKVKTRLGANIGMGRSAALFRIMTAQTISETAKGDWRSMLAVDPPCALTGWENLWPARLTRIGQGGGDLGDRMLRVMEAAPPGPVVVIGADAPGLRASHIRQAFFKLHGHDAVFGPAGDGGYWLIGLARRRAAPALFNGVRWSTRHALEDTRASLPTDFTVARLETMQDIDEAADLDAWGPRSTAG